MMQEPEDLNEFDLEEDEVEPSLTGLPKRQNYISNKEFLAEIHKSKLTYCSYKDERHTSYDAIINSFSEITPEFIEDVMTKKAARMLTTLREVMKAEKATRWAIQNAKIDPTTIQAEDLVFRLMTEEHLPLDPDRKRKRIGVVGDDVARTPFPAFKHYIIKDGTPVEVLRSFWKGDFETGTFCLDNGTMTRRLCQMFILLVDRIGRKGNWRGYTYLDEMKGSTMVQLCQVGLQFNEAKSDNPFAFYTTTTNNCFKRILQVEKKQHNIRDDLLVIVGLNPSNTRMNEQEHAAGLARHTGIVTTPESDEDK